MKTTTNVMRPELKNIYRFAAFTLAVAVGITALSARMVYLQLLLNQQAYQGGSTTPSSISEPLGESRGLVFDAKGRPLVKNVVDFAVAVTPNLLPIDQEQVVAERLGSILNIDPVLVETKIDSATGSLTEPVTVADGIDATVAQYIDENSDVLPGVQIVQTAKRQYLTGRLFAQIIGYQGRFSPDVAQGNRALGNLGCCRSMANN